MRLDRYLHEAGLGSRREVAALVRAGRVLVNGALVRDHGAQLPAGATVEANGAAVHPRQREPRVVAFHKPAGLVTAARDSLPTIYTVLPFGPDVLLPIGRLDRETEGLLLLTNDGILLHRLTDPKRHVEKEYEALVEKPLTDAMLAALRAPLDLQRGEVSRPAKEAAALAPLCLRLVIDEGKNRQVRRMVMAVGNKVTLLRRTRVGALGLGDLGRGEWRDLTKDEVNGLRRQTGLSELP
jgi:16S rRNA pseudouridine516 synthase